MKEYRQKFYHNTAQCEQLAALHLMKPSIPVTLLYLSQILSHGIERNTDRPETIEKWKTTEKELSAILQQYR